MEDYRLEQSGQEVQNILNGAAMQSDLTAETERATEAEQTLQGNIDIEERDRKAADLTLQGNIDAEELRAKAAEKQNADDIDALEEKVPSGASASNKLATESYVDDSVATATATFRGTYNLVSDLHLTVDATEQQIATALALAISTADNNDYCFVLVPTSSETPTEIKEIDRYKFNGTAWSFEYKLNNSGFTTAQWAAINSGITSGDVTKLAALPTNAQLTTLLNGKQDVLTFDSVPTEGSNNPVKSGGVYSAIDDEKGARLNSDAALQQAIEAILLLIPSAATSLNKLADKAFVNSSIATASATFRGTYNLVTDLSLTASATHAQIATALAGAVSDEDNNDYAFVQIPTSDATPTQIAKTERYKYNGTAWEYEYDLNNSGYTAAQWAAINSGITEALVTKLSALPTNAELTSALGVLTSSITTINQKIPSAASQANQLVDTAAMEAYIVQVLDILTASFNVTSTDGHVTVSSSQVDGKITSVSVSTSDIASAASLSLVEGRVTTAEGNISTNAADIANLQDAYAALTQSALVVVQPTDTWPVASPASKTIYRVVDRVNTPPQYYSDYMWNGTAMVLMATYDNAIDDVPTLGSDNLVKSGGVYFTYEGLLKRCQMLPLTKSNPGKYWDSAGVLVNAGYPDGFYADEISISAYRGKYLLVRGGFVHSYARNCFVSLSDNTSVNLEQAAKADFNGQYCRYLIPDNAVNVYVTYRMTDDEDNMYFVAIDNPVKFASGEEVKNVSIVDKPMFNNENPIKSKGVSFAYDGLLKRCEMLDISSDVTGKYYDDNGELQDAGFPEGFYTKEIDIEKYAGKYLLLRCGINAGPLKWAWGCNILTDDGRTDSVINLRLVARMSFDGQYCTYQIPYNSKKLQITYRLHSDEGNMYFAAISEVDEDELNKISYSHDVYLVPENQYDGYWDAGDHVAPSALPDPFIAQGYVISGYAGKVLKIRTADDNSIFRTDGQPDKNKNNTEWGFVKFSDGTFKELSKLTKLSANNLYSELQVTDDMTVLEVSVRKWYKFGYYVALSDEYALPKINRHLYTLGDSVTYGAGEGGTDSTNGDISWSDHLVKKISFAGYSKIAVDGCTTMQYNTSPRLYTQVSQIVSGNVDNALIMVMTGTNDVYLDLPMGDVDTAMSTPWNELDDTANFASAFRYNMQKLKMASPHSLLFCLIPLSPFSTSLHGTGYLVPDLALEKKKEQYREIERQICKYLSIPVIEVSKECGITAYAGTQHVVTSDIDSDSFMADNAHPNGAGNELIANLIMSKLIRYKE